MIRCFDNHLNLLPVNHRASLGSDLSTLQFATRECHFNKATDLFFEKWPVLSDTQKFLDYLKNQWFDSNLDGTKDIIQNSQAKIMP